jgi:hypothetical protein
VYAGIAEKIDDDLEDKMFINDLKYRLFFL